MAASQVLSAAACVAMIAVLAAANWSSPMPTVIPLKFGKNGMAMGNCATAALFALLSLRTIAEARICAGVSVARSSSNASGIFQL